MYSVYEPCCGTSFADIFSHSEARLFTSDVFWWTDILNYNIIQCICFLWLVLSNVFYLGNLCQVIKTFIWVFKKVLPPLGFPGGSEVKASAWNAGDPGFDPWVGKIPWRRKWQPTPVLLPGESHGGRSLVGYSPWSHKESDTTDRLHFHFSLPWSQLEEDFLPFLDIVHRQFCHAGCHLCGTAFEQSQICSGQRLPSGPVSWNLNLILGNLLEAVHTLLSIGSSVGDCCPFILSRAFML